MTCTGDGVSVSVRLIRDPVTTTSCNSVLLEAEELGACCASAGPARNAARAMTAAARGFIETAECVKRRSGADTCVGSMPLPLICFSCLQCCTDAALRPLKA